MSVEDASPVEVSASRTIARAGGPPLSILVASLLAWAGVLVSFLLLKRPAGLQEFLCPARAACETVLKSRYAHVAGVPLSGVGEAFYLAILGLLLLICGTASRGARLRLLEGVLWLVIAGFTFSVGLMFLQFGVLHAFCPLCTVSAFLMVGLLVAVVQARRVVAKEEGFASRSVAICVALFAAFPLVILMTSSFGAEQPSVWIDLSTAHEMGPHDARVQLVVFSDFQCPFCRLLEPTLRRIHEEFPQDVLLVFRSYPLDSHPRAFPAAVAAECAAEQGKFWEYHDQLFTEGGDLSEVRLIALAVSLGLDPARFAECRQSDRARNRVETSRRDAVTRGLEGVPALFLNGQRVEEGLDYEHLVQRIRKLLLATPGQRMK